MIPLPPQFPSTKFFQVMIPTPPTARAAPHLTESPDSRHSCKRLIVEPRRRGPSCSTPRPDIARVQLHCRICRCPIEIGAAARPKSCRRIHERRLISPRNSARCSTSRNWCSLHPAPARVGKTPTSSRWQNAPPAPCHAPQHARHGHETGNNNDGREREETRRGLVADLRKIIVERTVQHGARARARASGMRRGRVCLLGRVLAETVGGGRSRHRPRPRVIGGA